MMADSQKPTLDQLEEVHSPPAKADNEGHEPLKPMKRSASAVSFADSVESADQSSKSQAKPKMRYGKLLASITGASSSSCAPAEPPAERKVFNPAAAPAKPAMKTSRSQTDLSSGPLYPAVESESAASTAGLQVPNPATGLVGYQTRGGAALASALGVNDGLAIPPPCPPALPSMSTSSGLGLGGAAAAADGRDASHTATALSAGLAINPLAVDDMPLMAPPTATQPAAATATAAAAAATATAAADAADIHAVMPGVHGGDVTVQLSTPGYNAAAASVKVAPPDAAAAAAADGSMQRDQQPKGSAEWQHVATAAAGGWQVLPGGGSTVCKDIEAAGGVDIEPAALEAGGGSPRSAGGACDDDAASSGVIIPPGHQQPIPPFWSQLTFRSMLVGLLVGCGFLLLSMRLALVTGITPNLQVVIAGACWAVLRLYTFLLGRDMQCIPGLTAQEVSVAAAAALGVTGTAAAGGFGTVLLALQDPAAQRVGSSMERNLPSIVWSLAYGKLVCYLLLVVLSGALLMLAFRKPLFSSPVMTFATGAASGQLLNTLHTPAMSYHGHKQMNRFTQWSIISFLFSGYQWVFNNPACNGFTRFPTLGLQALQYSWNFDFKLSLCGLGIMAPLSVAWSLVVGAIISWGLLWPVLSSKQGSWFPTGLKPWDPRGVFGYYLATAMGLLFADAIYHAGRALVTAIVDWHNPQGSDVAAAAATAAAASAAQEGAAFSTAAVASEPPGPGLKQRKKKRKLNRHAWKKEALRILESDALSDASSLQFSLAAMERALRQHIFMSDTAWSWVGILGFVVCSCVTVAALPVLFSTGSGAAAGGASMADASGLKSYYLLAAAPLAALAALANSRGAGAVDINLADAYAKAGIVLFAAWAGAGNPGSVGAGLLCGGVLLGASTSALNAMYAWRAGYMTMTSPTAVFVAHMIGLGVGCLVAPAAWLMFDRIAASTPAGTANGLLASDKFYASPLVEVFRSTAAVATGGTSALPHAAHWLGLAAFAVGLTINIVRESLPAYLKGIVPLPAALGVVFLSGANVAVDLVVGAAARVFWRLRYPRSAEAYSLIVGCALIAGEGLWGLGNGLLGAFGIQPPICMTFTSAPSA